MTLRVLLVVAALCVAASPALSQIRFSFGVGEGGGVSISRDGITVVPPGANTGTQGASDSGFVGRWSMTSVGESVGSGGSLTLVPQGGNRLAGTWSNASTTEPISGQLANERTFNFTLSPSNAVKWTLVLTGPNTIEGSAFVNGKAVVSVTGTRAN